MTGNKNTSITDVFHFVRFTVAYSDRKGSELKISQDKYFAAVMEGIGKRLRQCCERPNAGSLNVGDKNEFS